MTSRLMTALLVTCTFGLLFSPYRSAATSQQPPPITLESIGDVLETYEGINSISVSEDGMLRVVSELTGDSETYRISADGSLQSLGKISEPTVKSRTGNTLTISKGTITVFDAYQKFASQFTPYLPTALAFLNNEDIVIASPDAKALLHVYSRTGQLLRSFGTVKVRDKTNAAQNRFLSKGKILVDAAGNVYYVYRYVPLIQKFSPEGKLLYETEVRGEAIDLQQNVAQRFFNTKKISQVGGVDIITAATVERKTGNLWIAMNGSSTSGVVYEYSSQGQKLREYALRVDSPGATVQNITNVKDIAVTGSMLYVLTTSQQVHSFNREDYAQARIKQPGPTISRQRAALMPAFAPSAAAKFAAMIQTGCGTAQPWANCSFNCPAPGVCPGPPFVPPNDTSNSSVQNCKAALVDSLAPDYTVVSAACTPYAVGTAMHTRGGCNSVVTICRSGTNSTHSVTLDCPAQSCQQQQDEEDCSNNGGFWNFSSNSCSYDSGGCDREEEANCSGWWVNCQCWFEYPSPILVDVAGDGFSLTDPQGGVNFDLNDDGRAERLAWTPPGADDAWLALDRNGNGTIDNGQELFGNYTPQPTPPAGQRKNGFLALAEYDKPEHGGNGDGQITKLDAIFAALRLWQDTNHNGFSEASELHGMRDLGLKSIDLDYRESKRRDQYGNQFRYRAKVKDTHDAQLGRWAWDVFLVSRP
jgi:hypothetical protein